MEREKPSADFANERSVRLSADASRDKEDISFSHFSMELLDFEPGLGRPLAFLLVAAMVWEAHLEFINLSQCPRAELRDPPMVFRHLPSFAG